MEAIEHTRVSLAFMKMESLAQSRLGTVMLLLISFLESALPVPLLTDPFLAAAITFNRAKAVWLVVATTISSAFGGFLAYYMAFFAFGFFSPYVSPTLLTEFNALVANAGASVLVVTLIGAVTPVPYTIVAWVVGVLAGNPLVFVAGSLLGRGFRYAIVGFCAYQFGPLAVRYARKYILLSSVVLVVLVGLFFWLKL